MVEKLRGRDIRKIRGEFRGEIVEMVIVWRRVRRVEIGVVSESSHWRGREEEREKKKQREWEE